MKYRPATYQSRWRSSAPWCCLPSARCHTEGRPLTLGREDTSIIRCEDEEVTRLWALLVHVCKHALADLSLLFPWGAPQDLHSKCLWNVWAVSAFEAPLCCPTPHVRGDLPRREYTVQQTGRVFVLQLKRTKCFSTDSCIFWWHRRGLSFQKSKRSRRAGLNGVLKWFSARHHMPQKLWDSETKPKAACWVYFPVRDFFFWSCRLRSKACLSSLTWFMTDDCCYCLKGRCQDASAGPALKVCVYLRAAKSVFVLLPTIYVCRMHKVAQQLLMCFFF